MTGRGAAPGGRDFDFLLGSWQIENRCLKRAFEGSSDWYEFEATSRCRHILDGRGNLDEYQAPSRGFSAIALRLFNPSTREGSIYWADARKGVLDPPVLGRSHDGRGDFYGDDLYEGRPIKVHFVWSGITTVSARWEQQFSDDGRQEAGSDSEDGAK